MLFSVCVRSYIGGKKKVERFSFYQFYYEFQMFNNLCEINPPLSLGNHGSCIQLISFQ